MASPAMCTITETCIKQIFKFKYEASAVYAPKGLGLHPVHLAATSPAQESLFCLNSYL